MRAFGVRKTAARRSGDQRNVRRDDDRLARRNAREIARQPISLPLVDEPAKAGGPEMTSTESRRTTW
jgi:hypothetical protein